MRKYLVPLLLFSAIGVVIIILVKSQGDDETRDDSDNPQNKEAAETPKDDTPPSYLKSGGRQTPTPLTRNKWLSELERVLQSGDLKHAHYYRAKLCENIPALLEDDVALRNLLDAIRKYAIESRDPEMRKVLLPILRVVTTAEATQIIEDEFYRTTDESERLILLDAMSNTKHNPDTAGLWAAEMAVNSDNSEYRHTAFLYIRNLSVDHHEIVVRTAKQIYAASARPEQRVAAVAAISARADATKDGREFLRARMRNPNAFEIMIATDGIEGWGTVRDAALLESLATQFPSMQDELRGRADRIRTQRRMEEDPEAAAAMRAAQADMERQRQRQREEQKNE